VWQESKIRKMPSCIPCKKRRENLCTPSGLLFNELVKSPRTILSCLEEMLNLIMEMDPGRYNRKACSVILYVLRLVIRVEGYMMYIIQNNEWRHSDRNDFSGTGASSSVRGLECSEENVSMIRSSAGRIRRCIDGHAFPMLESCTFTLFLSLLSISFSLKHSLQTNTQTHTTHTIQGQNIY
jgi:hypothetical protein